jgi:hypothetical protein
LTERTGAGRHPWPSKRGRREIENAEPPAESESARSSYVELSGSRTTPRVSIIRYNNAEAHLMCVEPAGEEIESDTLEDEEEHEEVLTHVADRAGGAVPGGSSVPALGVPLVGVAALGICLVDDPRGTRLGLPHVFFRAFLGLPDLMHVSPMRRAMTRPFPPAHWRGFVKDTIPQ